jgi:hypothetical protein
MRCIFPPKGDARSCIVLEGAFLMHLELAEGDPN